MGGLSGPDLERNYPGWNSLNGVWMELFRPGPEVSNSGRNYLSGIVLDGTVGCNCL